jgi:hypothetical protein
VNAYFRPHKGEKWRRQWEWLHKGTGRLAILLGLVNVSLGVFLVVGPKALWVSWFVLLSFLVTGAGALEVLLQLKRRRSKREAGMAAANGGGGGVGLMPMNMHGPSDARVDVVGQEGKLAPPSASFAAARAPRVAGML